MAKPKTSSKAKPKKPKVSKEPKVPKEPRKPREPKEVVTISEEETVLTPRSPLRLPASPKLPESLFEEREVATFAYPTGGGSRAGEATQEPTISPRTGRRDRGSFDRVTTTRRVHQLTALKRRARKMGSEYARAVLLAQSFVKMPDESEAAERGWREMRTTSDRFRPDFIAAFGSSAAKIRSLSRVRVRGTR